MRLLNFKGVISALFIATLVFVGANIAYGQKGRKNKQKGDRGNRGKVEKVSRDNGGRGKIKAQRTDRQNNRQQVQRNVQRNDSVQYRGRNNDDRRGNRPQIRVPAQKRAPQRVERYSRNNDRYDQRQNEWRRDQQRNRIEDRRDKWQDRRADRREYRRVDRRDNRREVYPQNRNWNQRAVWNGRYPVNGYNYDRRQAYGKKWQKDYWKQAKKAEKRQEKYWKQVRKNERRYDRYVTRSYYDRYNYRPIRWNVFHNYDRVRRVQYPTRYVRYADRNYYPSYEPYYANNDYYYDDDNYYAGYNPYYNNRNDRFDLTSVIVQTLISSFLPDSNLLGGNDYYYADNDYTPDYNYVNYAYAPQGYAYQNTQPYYTEYDPNGYAYSDRSLNEVYNRGYREGFEAGQRSVQYNNGDGYYNDPYVLANGSYYPYSTSLNRDRELLSQGYQLGYQDALNNQDGYYDDSYDNSGGDLVGLLLENVLSLS